MRLAKLREEFQAAGIDVIGMSADGNLTFGPDVTEQQRQQAYQIFANHNPTTPSVREQRLADARREIANQLPQINAAIELFAAGQGTSVQVRTATVELLRFVRFLHYYLELDKPVPDYWAPPEAN